MRRYGLKGEFGVGTPLHSQADKTMSEHFRGFVREQQIFMRDSPRIAPPP